MNADSPRDEPCTKIVILARGLGTRMRRASGPGTGPEPTDPQSAVAGTGVKALIPVGRPFLDHVLSVVALAGYRRVCLVVGPEHDALRDYYGRQVQARRLTFTFAVQQHPRGTADAVLAAEEFAGDDPFVTMNSDTYYPLPSLAGLRAIDGPGVALFDAGKLVEGSNIPAERLRHFAVGSVSAAGDLAGILEKPDPDTWARLPRPLLISMNLWRFDRGIFESCEAIRPSPRGELEIPDAVRHALGQGQRFRVVRVAEPVLDLSTREDIGPVTARLAGAPVDL